MALALADFTFVRDLVRQQAAIVLGDDKNYLVESRLGPVARVEGLPSLTALVDRLRNGASTELRRKVVEALTTNETSFFRDIKPFDALRRVVFPDLFSRRAASRQLRIWCAACSTGQEPYSIAMLLREDFSAHLRWNIQLLATDICRDLIARAREGLFSQIEVNRGLPARLLLHHFVQRGKGEWQCKEELRNLVQFRYLNLIEPWPHMLPQDIVFIRNVLIYFNNDTKRQIFARIRSILSPDGYLFLGGAETTMNIDDAFVRQEIAGTSCYRLR